MFERCLYFNVNSLARSVNRLWDAAFQEFELSPSHAYLLRLVLAQPGLSQKEIAAELKLEKSTVTRFVDALEEKGLVRRTSAEKMDKREQGIVPTANAKTIQDSLEKTGNSLYKKMLDEFGKDELTAFVAQLRSAAEKLP